MKLRSEYTTRVPGSYSGPCSRIARSGSWNVYNGIQARKPDVCVSSRRTGNPWNDSSSRPSFSTSCAVISGFVIDAQSNNVSSVAAIRSGTATA